MPIDNRLGRSMRMPGEPPPLIYDHSPLGRERTPSDDFFDHRRDVLARIRQAMAIEKAGRRLR